MNFQGPVPLAWPERCSLLKQPRDVEHLFRRYSVAAITLAATKLLDHFAVNGGPPSRAASARDSRITFDHSVEFVKTIALLDEVGVILIRGTLAPVYCCCRKQPA